MSRFSTAGRQRRLNVELFLAISARELFFWLNGTCRYVPVRVDGWRGLEEADAVVAAPIRVTIRETFLRTILEAAS
jgi:hypothetical protein